MYEEYDTFIINTIHTCLAVASGVSRQAGTIVGIVSVLAISAVGARVTLAFVEIYVKNRYTSNMNGLY